MGKFEWAFKAMLACFVIYLGGAYMISKWGAQYEEIARVMVIVLSCAAGTGGAVLAIGMAVERAGFTENKL
jgi:hypothetical protein